LEDDRKDRRNEDKKRADEAKIAADQDRRRNEEYRREQREREDKAIEKAEAARKEQIEREAANKAEMMHLFRGLYEQLHAPSSRGGGTTTPLAGAAVREEHRTIPSDLLASAAENEKAIDTNLVSTHDSLGEHSAGGGDGKPTELSLSSFFKQSRELEAAEKAAKAQEQKKTKEDRKKREEKKDGEERNSKSPTIDTAEEEPIETVGQRVAASHNRSVHVVGQQPKDT
jgi:membrane protein involved in colicin uptake